MDGHLNRQTDNKLKVFSKTHSITLGEQIHVSYQWDLKSILILSLYLFLSLNIIVLEMATSIICQLTLFIAQND